MSRSTRIELSSHAHRQSQVGRRRDDVHQRPAICRKRRSFTADPRPAVAQVLTLPLMVALAQAAYNPRLGEPLPPIDPDELYVSADEPSAEEITFRLLDSPGGSFGMPHLDRSWRWSPG